MFKVNDFVYVLKVPKQYKNRVLYVTPTKENEQARIVETVPGGVIVNNMNMPFQGTLCNSFIPIKYISRRAAIGN